MSLYYEAAAILANESNTGGSLKNRIFNAGKDLVKAKDGAQKMVRSSKIAPQQLYALIAESTKWSAVLTEVIERAGLLELERKLTPILALLLTHDLLLAKKGVQAPAGHVLAIAVSKHKGRLFSELSRIRIKRHFATLEDFRAAIEAGVDRMEQSSEPQPARWVRINALLESSRTGDKDFKEFTRVETIGDVTITPSPGIRVYHEDQHIPDLLAMPRRIDMSRTDMYKKGQIILQDKASCFPAYLLDPAAMEGDIIDACAAPGNKTTHLAALLHAANASPSRRVFACERDKQRSKILQTMITKAGADEIVQVLANTDFLSLDPNDKRFRNVGALLLDPSCSGSGIVGRDDGPPLILPKGVGRLAPSKDATSSSKKRKRGGDSTNVQTPGHILKPLATAADDSDDAEESPIALDSAEALRSRLNQLSAFQLRLLTHAMHFPFAKRITYSTCSNHFIENESVVLAALRSPVASSRGWKLLPRAKQVDGMRRWHMRGDRQACVDAGVSDGNAEEVADACLRCVKGTVDGTMGFFVVAFERDGSEDRGQLMEWGRGDQADVVNGGVVSGSSDVPGSENGMTGTKTPDHQEDLEWEGFDSSEDDGSLQAYKYEDVERQPGSPTKERHGHQSVSKLGSTQHNPAVRRSKLSGEKAEKKLRK